MSGWDRHVGRTLGAATGGLVAAGALAWALAPAAHAAPAEGAASDPSGTPVAGLAADASGESGPDGATTAASAPTASASPNPDGAPVTEAGASSTAAPAGEDDASGSAASGSSTSGEETADEATAGEATLGAAAVGTASSAPATASDAVPDEPAPAPAPAAEGRQAAGVGFVYVDESALAPGDTQSVAVVLDDEALSLSSARLTYVDGTGASHEAVASALAGNAALFQFEAGAEGTYVLTSLSYTATGEPDGTPELTANLSDASDEPCSFVVSAQASVMSAGAAPSVQTSFYAPDADGDPVRVGSLGEALSAASAGAPVAASSRAASSRQFVIALDPGHGGADSGALGNGLVEKDLTWKITEYCREALERYTGVKVVLTRTEDELPSIRERAQRAYEMGANVVVSIHINSDETGQAHGAEVWFPSEGSWKNDQTNVPGAQLAQRVLDKLTALGLGDRGTKVRLILDDEDYAYPDGSDGDYYGIIRYARQLGFAGVIVEHAFITNGQDAALLASDDELRRMGYADAEGIAQTYGLGTASPARFGDALPGMWFVDEGWVDYVTDHGLMTGVQDPDGVARNFYPNGDLTRGQLATILYRAAHPDATDTTDPDDFASSSGFADGNGPAYYNAAIAWCASNGVVTGYPDGPDEGKFLPDKAVTREELATMVYRFAQVMGDAGADAPEDALDGVADASAVQPFALDAMRWCAANGVLTGNLHPEGLPTLEPQATATRAQGAKVVTVLFRDVLGE